MAKKLNEASVLNELHEGSAFFGASPTSAGDTVTRQKVAKPRGNEPGRKIAATALPAQPTSPEKPVNRFVDHAVDQTIHQRTIQSTEQTTEQFATPPANQPGEELVGQSIGELANGSSTGQFDLSPVLAKPKAFYITEKQDEELDLLVKMLSVKLKGKVTQKIDRSVTARLILESSGLTRDETVNRLADLLISRLTNQLIGRQNKSAGT